MSRLPQVASEGERPAGADRTLYALHPIPLSDVKAVRKHAPSWGTQHVVLVLNNGLTLPPLYFAAGGVKSLFSALKEVRLCSKTVVECMLQVVGTFCTCDFQSRAALLPCC